MDLLNSIIVVGLQLAIQYILLSLGFSLIFGVLGVINFAHGAFYMLGGFFAFSICVTLGLPYWLALALAMLITAFFGFVIEILLIERFIDNELVTMLITLGIYLIISTGSVLIYGAEPLPFRFPYDGMIAFGKIGIKMQSVISLGLCIFVLAITYVILYYTKFGVSVRALADDRTTAITCGVSPAFLFAGAFAIATGIAGLAGALITPMLNLDPTIAEGALISAFIVVILGGLGSLVGAVIASIVVGFINAAASILFGGSTGSLILFAIVLITLAIRPQGLMGVQVREI